MRQQMMPGDWGELRPNREPWQILSDRLLGIEAAFIQVCHQADSGERVRHGSDLEQRIRANGRFRLSVRVSMRDDLQCCISIRDADYHCRQWRSLNGSIDRIECAFQSCFEIFLPGD